jgi:hypothetical protein
MSPDELGFEAIDDELGRTLRAAAPVAPNADRTLEELRPRFAQARRRRRAGFAAMSGAAVAGVVALVFAVGAGSPRSVETPPASRGEDRVTTTTTPFPTVVPGPVLVPTTPTTEPDDDGAGNSGRGDGGDDADDEGGEDGLSEGSGPDGGESGSGSGSGGSSDPD